MIPDPARFPRRIALFVTGLNPQVVTETLWALARQPSPYVPTEISLLTTAEGRERALLLLLPPSEVGSEGPEALAALGRDIGVPGLAGLLPLSAIHVIRDASGVPLRDIADDQASVAAADAITALIRDFTSDPLSALHVSIAGGRKTMGFVAGYALSLFGRPQDRLSHVLVQEPFQSHPQFFFPPAVPRVLFSRDNRPLNTADAAVRLANIPFVRLREGFSDAALDMAASFSAAVAELQRRFVPPALRIDLGERAAYAAGVPLPLSHSLLGTLLWFARDRLSSEHGIDWRTADPASLVIAIREVAGIGTVIRRTERALKNGIEREWLAEKKARINAIVMKVLGTSGSPYCIELVGRRPRTRYRLAIGPEAITIMAKSSTETSRSPL